MAAAAAALCFFGHPPFVDERNGTAEGVFWDLALSGLRECVGPDLRVEARYHDNEDQLMRHGARQCNLSFPVTESALLSKLQGLAFIPVIRTPGAVWLTPAGGLLQGRNQLAVIAQAWPLLVIILVSCAFAGILVWLMERLKNPQEFPRPFVRGFWEGCWWAFISMTTVGYGDRSPKTVAGRLFAFAWIGFGLVVTSMFTAGITTALSQSSLPAEEQKLFQAKMSVIKGSYEEVLVHEIGATPIEVQQWQELVHGQQHQHQYQQQQQQQQYGAMMEHYMYMHIRAQHPKAVSGLLPQLVLKRPSVRGLLSNLQPEVNQCIVRWLLPRQISVYGEVVGHKHKGGNSKLGDLQTPEGIAKSLFFANHLHLLLLTVCFCILFGALLCWERCYWAPRNPDYHFIEHNWKYDRQKKEAEFAKQLDFKSYYKRRKSSLISVTTPVAERCTCQLANCQPANCQLASCQLASGQRRPTSLEPTATEDGEKSATATAAQELLGISEEQIASSPGSCV